MLNVDRDLQDDRFVCKRPRVVLPIEKDEGGPVVVPVVIQKPDPDMEARLTAMFNKIHQPPTNRVSR